MIVIKPAKVKIRQGNSEITVVQQNVWITRGDSGYVTMDLKDDDDQPFDIGEGDVVRCHVRETAESESILFEADITVKDDEVTWHLLPENTEGLDIGTYAWDAEVRLSNGDVFTFIPVSEFHVIQDVTRGGA